MGILELTAALKAAYLSAGAIAGATLDAFCAAQSGAIALNQALWYSPADRGVTSATDSGNGDYAFGIRIYPLTANNGGTTHGAYPKIAGVRAYARFASYPRTIKCSVWNAINTRIATANAVVSAQGIYNVLFSAPVEMVTGKHDVVVWDTSGSGKQYFGLRSDSPTLHPAVPFLMGPQCIMQGFGYGPGDFPITQVALLGTMTGFTVEPIFGA